MIDHAAAPHGEYQATIPFRCPSVLAEPVEFDELRRSDRITRVRTAAGCSGWLVTRADHMETLASGFQVGKSHPNPAQAPRLWHAALFAPHSNFATEVEDHRTWRSPLNKAFGRLRVESFRPRAEQILTDLLDRMIDEGPPADLCAAVAEPFAAQAVLEFVGLPNEAHRLFVAESRAIRISGDGRGASEFSRYALELLRRRKRQPVGDVVSVAALSDHPRVQLENLVATADFETVAARIGYAVLFLLAYPAQFIDVRDHPSTIRHAVEEILRMAVPGGSWIPRHARTDVVHRSAHIRTGDLVVFAIQAVNRDPARFTDPHRFDVRRHPNRHLGFGVGKFYCPGAALSRMLLSLVLATLPRRLPSLRLNVPVAHLADNHGKVTGGLTHLPVAWSESDEHLASVSRTKSPVTPWGSSRPSRHRIPTRGHDESDR